MQGIFTIRSSFILMTGLFVLMSLNLNAQDKGRRGEGDDLGCMGGCASGCVGGCSNMLFDFIFTRHRDIMSKKELDPTITSLEARSYFGYNSLARYAVVTTIGGRLGIFSTEFRLNALSFGPDLQEDEHQTLDWQILKLNLLRKEMPRIWIGTGFLYDGLMNKYFNEHFLGFELNFNDYTFFTEFEVRAAIDYKQKTIVFHEENLRLLYRFLNTRRFYAYFSLGGVYQQYLEKKDLWMVQSGIILNLHRATRKKK